MKRLTLTALVAALMLLPASALARHGHHHRKHQRGHKVHRVAGTVGTVASFDSASGELVIETVKGRELSALVTDRTRLRCDDDAPAARTSRHGDDDDRGDDDDDRGDDDGADHDAGDDHGDDDGDDHDADDDDDAACTTDDLVAGAVVRRARIDLDGDDDAVWTKIVLGS